MSRKSFRSKRAARIALALVFAFLVPPSASALAESFPPSKVVFESPIEDVCVGRLTVRWKASVDTDGAVVGYRVAVGDGPPVTVTETSYTIGWSNGPVEVTVQAIDDDGLVSVLSTETYVVAIASCVPDRPVLSAAPATPTTVALSWAPLTDPDGTVVEYRVFQDGVQVKTVAGTSALIIGLQPDTEYTFEVDAVDKNGAHGLRSLPVEVRTASVPKTAPSNVVFETPLIKACPTSSLTVRWKPAADADGAVVGYRVTIDGRDPVDVSGTSYTVEISGRVSVSVSAIDNDGLLSAPSTTAYDIPVAECVGPTPPTVSLGAVTMTSIELKWTGSVDPDGSIGSYDILRDGSRVASVSGATLSYVDRGLVSGTQYRYAVQARDADGIVGQRSNEVSATTPSEVGRDWNFAATGSTSLKTLAKGNLALRGSLTASPTEAASSFVADLTLANASGRLIAGGFLPLTARFGFVFSGPTTVERSAETGQIKTSSKIRIKVLDVKLFGAIPLVAGNTCQTKRLTDLAMTSTGAFKSDTGGTLTGTYGISELNGCGALNGLVSPLTAGAGNSISLTLAPRG